MTDTILLTDEERVAALHELPLFLPTEYLQTKILPAVLYTILVLTVLFWAVIHIMQSYSSSSSSTTMIRKTSYQFVNCMVNLILGLLGVYYCCTRNTLPSNAETVEERVTTSVENHLQLYWLSCIQFGYQLWALPVGYFLVEESSAMLYHHVAVIGVASLSSLFTNGFVFHNPYFFGLYELSSVPLAVMNFLKDNPKLQKRHLQIYTAVRMIFCVMFLFIRIYMMIPRKADFLRLCFFYLKTSPYWQQQLFLGVTWLGSFFLACLQVFWGFLIVKGIVKMVLPKKKKKKSNPQNGQRDAVKKKD